VTRRDAERETRRTDMQASSTRDLAVGLFVLCGIAAIAYLSANVGGLSIRGGEGIELFAVFDDIGGLSHRSPVKIAGVKVGQVSSIELDEDLRARVGLSLDASLEVPIDSSASIRTAGLLGDQFISLEAGAEEELLSPGERFEYTESALSLDKLVGRLVHGDALGDE
jgi:phospholipid/cholesterol/gamma-HCH transport system substrate-binding protein